MEVFDDEGPHVMKPVQTKWASRFIHGDLFETRKVVLDESLRPLVLAKVTSYSILENTARLQKGPWPLRAVLTGISGVIYSNTIGPKGATLRDFFLQQLRNTMVDAAGSGDHVLIMIFSHGDYDSAGGLCIGVDLFTNNYCEKYLKPSHVAPILSG